LASTIILVLILIYLDLVAQKANNKLDHKLSPNTEKPWDHIKIPFTKNLFDYALDVLRTERTNLSAAQVALIYDVSTLVLLLINRLIGGDTVALTIYLVGTGAAYSVMYGYAHSPTEQFQTLLKIGDDFLTFRLINKLPDFVNGVHYIREGEGLANDVTKAISLRMGIGVPIMLAILVQLGFLPFVASSRWYLPGVSEDQALEQDTIFARSNPPNSPLIRDEESIYMDH
jgi:hypothetical protein